MGLMSGLKVLVGTGLMAVAGAAGTIGFWLSTAPLRDTAVRVEVREGAGLGEVARILADKDVVRWPLFFRFYSRFHEASRTIKAGEYEFSPGLTPYQVLEKLLKGSYVLVEFRHPPGFNLYQVADSLETTFPHIAKSEWMRALKDPTLVKSFAPEASTLEGYLFPDVYRIRAKPRVDEVVQVMVKNLRDHLSTGLVEAGRTRGLTLHQLVTLASIVEKETGVPAERPLISAVFHSRLRLGMRLQTDPTVIYGIWERFDGNLRKADLIQPTAYNTYAIAGLPPGPIANPGVEALEAAAHPADADYLYFVARGDGSHHFSKSLSEHNQAVHTFQIAPLRKRKP